MSKLKIYLASSWKNEGLVLIFAELLRGHGYEVDAFCDASCGRFICDVSCLPDKPEEMNHITAMQHQEFQRAFREDKKWLDWADVCVLILPCGRSAHLEAGYAKGQGKGLIIMSPMLPGEWDVMYGFADYVLSLEEPKTLIEALIILEASKLEVTSE